MAEQAPLVSIVIRCLNEELYIARLLSGIKQQTVQDVEVIVVDSGSVDATLSIVSQFTTNILHIRPEDFSFGRSLNLGCASARGKYIVIASAHVYPVYRDWLERLLEPFQDTQVALAYGKQRGDDTITKYSEQQVMLKWFPEESISQQDHPFCNNANAVVTRHLWEQLPYDESLTGMEDMDWSQRAMELGHKISYASQAEIVHVHNEPWSQIYNRYRREAVAYRRISSQERFTLWEFARLSLGNVISDYYHAWHDGKLFSNLISIPLFRLTQFWGAYRGFKQSGPVSDRLKQRFYYPNGLSRNPSAGNEDEGERAMVSYTEHTDEA